MGSCQERERFFTYSNGNVQSEEKLSAMKTLGWKLSNFQELKCKRKKKNTLSLCLWLRQKIQFSVHFGKEKKRVRVAQQRFPVSLAVGDEKKIKNLENFRGKKKREFLSKIRTSEEEKSGPKSCFTPDLVIYRFFFLLWNPFLESYSITQKKRRQQDGS